MEDRSQLNLVVTLIGNLKMKHLLAVHQWLVLVCVSGAIGAVINVILFFLIAFVFAGAEGDSWVRWYFGDGGIAFLFVTVMLMFFFFPFIKRLRKSDANDKGLGSN